MSGLVGILVGLAGGWVACYVLVGRRVRQRAEWWLTVFERYAEGQHAMQQRAMRDTRRPW